MLAGLEDEPYTAAYRWGLMISDSLKMEFQLLSLPETSESESFKYSFKLSSGFEHTANQYLAFVKLSRKVLSEYVL
jgi:hypothetical protein